MRSAATAAIPSASTRSGFPRQIPHDTIQERLTTGSYRLLELPHHNGSTEISRTQGAVGVLGGSGGADSTRYNLGMPNDVYAYFETSEGKFKARLFPDKAPKTVENFTSLAEGAKTGKPFYDDLIFHRVIPDFMIQGGCPEGSGRGGPGYKFADEFHPGLRHTKKGLLSMANSGPNTNGSQFFVTVAPTPWLDERHTIFGEVTEGYEVVDKISRLPRDSQDRPKKEVKINSVTIERTEAGA